MLQRIPYWIVTTFLLLALSHDRTAAAVVTSLSYVERGSQVGSEAQRDALSPAIFDQLDEFVRRQMVDVGIPGVAYTICGPTEILHTGFFGVDGHDQPINSTTAFLWGSLAKSVTATLVMTLVESGELQLDAPLTAYLPAFHLRDVDSSSQITIRHLLSHSSGIPTSVTLTDRQSDRQATAVIPALANVAAVSAPGAEYHYSSTNYLLLTAVIEAVTGKPFIEVLTKRLLNPLGMEEAITTPVQAAERLPPGHRFFFGKSVAFTTPYVPTGVGYGYLGGTLGTAVAFAQTSLGSQPDRLSAAQRSAMFQGEVVTSGEHLYGLGWRRWPLAELAPGTKGEMVWHGGAAPGYQAVLILLPDREQAIIVLQNVYGVFQEPRLLDTAFGLVRLLVDAEPVPSQDDGLYPAALAMLSGLLLLLVALIAWSIRGLAHPQPRRRSQLQRWGRLAGWLILLGMVIYGLGVYLPAYFDIGLSQMVLWAPDLAWLVWTILALALLLLVLRLIVSFRLFSDIELR